jgi:hypothetical protein
MWSAGLKASATHRCALQAASSAQVLKNQNGETTQVAGLKPAVTRAVLNFEFIVLSSELQNDVLGKFYG